MQRPENVQVFCGLPLTSEDFTEDARRGPPDRFAPSHLEKTVGRSFAKGWTREHLDGAWGGLNDQRRGDLALLRTTLTSLSRCGVEVHERATVDAFLGASKRAVVVLVTHCTGRSVELRDAMLDAEVLHGAFVERARTGDELVIDLTLCHGDVPHDALRRRLGNGPRMSLGLGPAPLGLKAAALLLAIRRLGETEMDYIEAYSAAWNTIKGRVHE